MTFPQGRRIVHRPPTHRRAIIVDVDEDDRAVQRESFDTYTLFTRP
jgi:hypothetical protein